MKTVLLARLWSCSIRNNFFSPVILNSVEKNPGITDFPCPLALRYVGFHCTTVCLTYCSSVFQVRRSAAKCLSAVLGSRPELLSEFYKTVSPALILRFKGYYNKLLTAINFQFLYYNTISCSSVTVDCKSERIYNFKHSLLFYRQPHHLC